MQLSARVEYALLALLILSNPQLGGKPLQAGEIADSQSIPRRYLDEILMLLRRSGIVQSQRGVKGGYWLAKEPHQIALWEVVTVLEGTPDSHLGNGDRGVTKEQIAVTDVWRRASQAILGAYTLQDLWQHLSGINLGNE